jgi:hypothetical protein
LTFPLRISTLIITTPRLYAGWADFMSAFLILRGSFEKKKYEGAAVELRSSADKDKTLPK